MSREPGSWESVDECHMREALRLAEKGRGKTRPNPPVGAVVVAEGDVIGAGFHQRAGEPHAEVHALQDAGSRAAGATLYVTLEPCSTRGRTPPCTEQIVDAGIRRVVIAVRDPNPAHDGKGIRRLRQHGIQTDVGLCGDEARDLIAPFAHWIRTGIPYVTLKMGMTLDGRIADARQASRWITSSASRAMVQSLRQKVDAIIVGSGTACADNPTLLARATRTGILAPYRVVVDSRGRTPLDARVLTDAHAATTIMATTALCPVERQRAYARHGVNVWVLPLKQGQASLRTLMRRLGKRGCLHVLCEGGGLLAGGLVKAGLVNEFLFFVAPRFLGGDGVPVLGGGNWRLATGPRLVFSDVQSVGDDLLVVARPARRESQDDTPKGGSAGGAI